MRAPHATDRRQVVLTATRPGPGSRPAVPAAAGGVAGAAAAGADPAGARAAAAGGADPGEAQPVLTGPPRPAGPASTAAGSRARWGSRTFGSLQTRNYRLFAAGQVVSNTGSWMQRVAQDWLVLELTHNSGTALGITTGLQFLPMLLQHVGRRDRRPLLQAAHPDGHAGRDGRAGADPRRAGADRRGPDLAGLRARLRARPGHGGGQPDPAGVRGRDGRPGRDGERDRAEQRGLQPGQDRRPGGRRARDRGGRHPDRVPGQRRLVRRGDRRAAS